MGADGWECFYIFILNCGKREGDSKTLEMAIAIYTLKSVEIEATDLVER